MYDLRPEIREWMTDEEKVFYSNINEYFQKVILTIGFQNISEVKIIPKGASSCVISFETDHIKKVCKFSFSTNDFEACNVFYQICKTQNIPCLNPGIIVILENNVIGYILDYVEGTHLSDLSKSDPNYSNMKMLSGNILAQIHKISITDVKSIDSQNFIPIITDLKEHFENIYLKAAKTLLENSIINESEYNSVKEVNHQLFEKYNSEAHNSLCHGDYSSGNIFYKDNSLIVFDPSPEIKLPILDLGRYLVYESYEEDFEDNLKYIMEGYHQILDLSEEDLNYTLIISSVKKMKTAIKTQDSKRLECYSNLFRSRLKYV